MHWNFTGVPPVTDGSAGLDYIKAQKRTLPRNGANHDSAWHWGYAFGSLAELEQAGGAVRESRRAQSRYDLERSVNVDLADMRLTRLDALDEMQKPFWEA